MNRHLVVGMGEVGVGLYNHLLSRDVELYTFTKGDDRLPTPDIDVMHICFPYNDNFIRDVNLYREDYKPRLIMIYTTVPVGTVKQIPWAVHSPVEGVHPRLSEGFDSFLRIVGFNEQFGYSMVSDLLTPVFDNIHMVYNTDKTELMKLLSTGFRYPAQIMLANEQESICKRFGFDYAEIVTDYDRAYNAGYELIGRKDVQRPLAYPGVIGGHCMKANMDFLKEAVGTRPVDNLIRQSDKMKRKELND